MVSNDTIFALSSGGLPSGVAVVRISGPQCAGAVETIAGALPPARKASLRSIRNRNGHLLDQGLVIYFPGPASFTGEDSAELHVHGGRATVRAVLDELGDLPGLRSADPGEFSRRAFHNGKLDLVEIEGLADIVAAQTEMQRRLAIEHASGGLSNLYGAWARRLTHARAMIEAELDFADEDDIPGAIGHTIRADLEDLASVMRKHLRGSRTAEIIRDGLTVVITGSPNVGKSSLLNYLANRDVAIVTDIPGTTRDIVSVDLDLDGFAVRLVDTAGIRETTELVEREGIRRAKAAVETADLVLHLVGPEEGTIPAEGTSAQTIRVFTKQDIGIGRVPRDGEIAISTLTGAGIDLLLACVRSRLPDLTDASAFAIPSRQRHNETLNEAVRAIENALQISDDLELQAEWLRVAATEIGRIPGRVDVENLLDVIFSEFCIGK
jgi:tRNA modification GTPase